MNMGRSATKVTHLPTGEICQIADTHYYRSHTKQAKVCKEILKNRVAYLKFHHRNIKEIFVYDLVDVLEEDELLYHRTRII